jgi:uncharacterized protein YfaQ (DUF2300 family)
MWCGACYVLKAETRFHVRSLSDKEDANGKDAKDLERLIKSWGQRGSPHWISTLQETVIMLWSLLSVTCVFSGNYERPPQTQLSPMIGC